MKTSRISLAALAALCLTATALPSRAAESLVQFESATLEHGGTVIRWSSPIDWRSVLTKKTDPTVYARPTGQWNSNFLVLADGSNARNVAREISRFEIAVRKAVAFSPKGVKDHGIGKSRPDFRMVDDTRKNAQEKYARMKSKPGRPSEGPSNPGSREPDTPRTPAGPFDDSPRGGAANCEEHDVFTFCPDLEVGEIPNDPEWFEGSLEELCEGDDDSWFCADLSPTDPVGDPNEDIENVCEREDLDPELRELLCNVPELEDRLNPSEHPTIDDCARGESEQEANCDAEGKNCTLETTHSCESRSGGEDFFCIQVQENCEAHTNGQDIFFVCEDLGTMDCYNYGVD